MRAHRCRCADRLATVRAGRQRAASTAAPRRAIGADGYCTECGLRQPEPRDHQELDLGTRRRASATGACATTATRTPCAPGAAPRTAPSWPSSATACPPRRDPDVASQAAADVRRAPCWRRPRPGAGSRWPRRPLDAVAAAARPWPPIAVDRRGVDSRDAPSCTLVSAVVAGTARSRSAGSATAGPTGSGRRRRGS